MQYKMLQIYVKAYMTYSKFYIKLFILYDIAV